MKKEKKIEVKIEKEKKPEVDRTICNDKDCHIHGNLKIRGRVFKGKVIKKFHKRIVMEFERMIYIRKYERYKKSKTKINDKISF